MIEWEDEKNWIKANPGLGEIKELKGLRDEVDAKRATI